MKTLKEKYQELEADVLDALKEKVKHSNKVSEHVQEKCITVNAYGFKELTVIDQLLTFIDSDGLQYSVHNCDLEDLIDILN